MVNVLVKRIVLKNAREMNQKYAEQMEMNIMNALLNVIITMGSQKNVMVHVLVKLIVLKTARARVISQRCVEAME